MMLHTHGTWGERVVTRETPYGLTTILFLDPNKRCSWHKHKHSFNQFYVISGILEIKTDIGPKGQINITRLGPGQFFTVQPGVMHEFRTKDEITIVEEIAYVEYDKSDIDRDTLGGDMNE
jgi:mannose-6-phosphate isomerase-like protein (cupin superfamily)